MISSEAKISDTVSNGMYNYKIDNVFFNHRSGPITAAYDLSPCYALLCFCDVNTAAG